MPKTLTPSSFAHTYSGLAIFLLAFLALLIPSGYSVGAVLLLVGGGYVLFKYQPQVCRDDKVLFAVLIAFTLEAILNSFWHDLGASSYDKAIRFTLAISAFYLIRWAKPLLEWVWSGLACGALAAGLFAAFQVFVVGLDRAGGLMHPIQFGNLSMLMGLFCLAGLGWALSLSDTKKTAYVLLLLLGALGGAAGSFLSGSRGGWVGTPFILLIIFKAYYPLFSLRTKMLVVIGLLVAGFAVISSPHIPIKDRLNEAIHDVQQYRSGNSDTSVGARFEMWQGALQLGIQKPILGWSKDGYQQGMIALADQGKADPVVKPFTHAHNEFLDQIAKHGFVGLAVLLAMYLAAIRHFGRYINHPSLPLRAVAVAGLLLPAAYIDFGLSQTFLAHNSGVMIFAFWLMVWAGYLRNLIEQYNEPAASLR